MPIPLGAPPSDERLEALLKAAEITPPGGTPGVTSCPLSTPTPEEPKPQDPEPKKPIRMLFWHIFELGGGFYMPSVRPAYVADACARLIRALDVHVVVLQGLTRTTQEVPTKHGSGAAAYISLDPEPRDTGPEEARRILERLQALDGGAGWQMELPRARGSGEYLYHRWTTAAFLYASAKGVTFQKMDLIQTSTHEAAGVTGSLVMATFDAPDYQSRPLRVMTSLGLATPERPWEQLRVAAPLPERAPTAAMPDSAIVFLSAPGNVGSGLDEFEDEVDAEFQRPGVEGTVLGDEFWKVVAETRDGLLDNFVAMNPADVLLQDREMHWEALRDPTHTREADQLPGFLADSMMVVHRRRSPPPKVQEMRVVDLIAASLPADAIAALKADPINKTADGGPPPERSTLVGQRKIYRSESARGPEPEVDPANVLSECGYFSRMLSRHWPLVAQFLLESK